MGRTFLKNKHKRMYQYNVYLRRNQMKTYLTALLVGIFMFAGVPSLFAYNGHFHSANSMNEQEVLTQIKQILPEIQAGTNKVAVALASSRCNGNVTFSNAKADIDTVWVEDKGMVEQSYFAHYTFDIDCPIVSGKGLK
jgi:hypothetical protein